MFDWIADRPFVLAAIFVAPYALGAAALAIDVLQRPKEPSDDDVRRAAEHYREYYRERAFEVIGDHMLAATFAPTGEHRRFLKRVSQELLRAA